MVAAAEALEIILHFPLLYRDQNVPGVFVLPKQSLEPVEGESRPVLSPSKKTASLRSGVFTSQLKDSWEGSVSRLMAGLSGMNAPLGLVGLQHPINPYITPEAQTGGSEV